MSSDDPHAQEEDLIAQRIQEDQGWVRVQKRTFTRWVNENLKTTEYQVESLEDDFGDGLKLVTLLQQLAGKPIGARVTKKPRIRAQKLENVKICFDFMNREGVEMVNIDNQDVADGNMKLILGMVWHLILHYQIATGFSDDDGSKGGPKNRIIKWVNSKINPWGKEIKNLGPDWNHGDILACLVNALAPGLVPDFAEMKPENARDNIDRAMEMAKEWMDIPRVIEPEDMMDPNVDELSMMTYLSYFPNAKVKDGAPCVNPGRVIARGPGITGVGLKPGKPAEFEIDASKAGENGRDKVKVEVIGPDGEPVKVDLNNNGDLTYTGAYYPEDDGQYTVKVTLVNCPIPKSPFKVGIYGDTRLDVSKVKVEGPGVTGEGILPGDVAPFTITYKDAGRGQPKVDVYGPDHQPIHVVMDNDKKEGVCKCEYQPGVFGEYTVAITYAGLPVPNSPFKVPIKPTVDINKVKTEGPGLSRCKVDEPTWFKVHTAGAGKGDLDIKIEQSDGTLLEPKITDDGKGTFKVDYTPKMTGNYKVTINYGRCKVPKSPFNVVVVPPGDAGEVIVNGDALHGIRVGMTGKLFVDASKAGKGNVKVIIIGPDNKPLEQGLEIIKSVDGVTEYGFTPECPGPYVFNVTFSGHPVPGSPFDTTVKPALDIDRIKLIVDRNNPPRINKPYKFTVDCSDAGPGPVLFGFIGDEDNDNPDKPRKDILVIVCDDKGNPIKDKKGKPITIDVKDLKNAGIAHFTFTPEIEGPIYLKVQYDGKDVPKSPMKVNVSSGIDMTKVKVYGDGITNDTPVRANKPLTITIDATHSGAGPISLDYPSKLGYTIGKDNEPKDLKINIVGPNGEPMTCDVKKRNDKVFEVTIEPELVGTLNVEITDGLGKEHAPKSPIKINVKPSVDASKIVIGGDGIDKDKVPRKDKLCVLDVDAEKAGNAPFSIAVNGVDKTPESSKKPEKGKPKKPGDKPGEPDKDSPDQSRPGFGPDGKPTPGNYIAPDGTIKDKDDRPVKGKDGKPLTCALGGRGNPKEPKTDDNGNLLGPDGKPLIGSDGFPVKTAAGPDGPTSGSDGTLYGNDGKPLLGKDGEPLKAAQMHNGKPLCNNDGEILGPDGKPVTAPNGEPLKSGKTPIGLSVLPDGSLMGPSGKPFCGPDNNPLKCGLDGDKKPVIDEKGALCGPDGKPLVGPDGKGIKPGAGSLGPSVKPDGSLVTADGRPIKGTDGKPLKAAMGSCGKPKVNDNGDMVGPDGKPLLDENGKPIKAPDAFPGPHIGDDGTLTKTDGTPLLGKDGKPLKTATGGRPQTDKDGNLLDDSGKPLVGADGKPITSSGGPYGPLVAPDGTVEGPGGSPVKGPDDKPLVCEQSPEGLPCKDGDGNLIGPDGKPLIGPDDRPVVFGKDTDEEAKPDEQPSDINVMIIGPDDKPVPATVKDLGDGKFQVQYEPKEEGPHKLDVVAGGEHAPKCPVEVDVKPSLDLDNLNLGYGTGTPRIGPNGTLYDENGKPLKDKDGKPLKCALGPDGKPLTDKDGNLLGPDGKPLLGPDGKPIKAPETGEDDKKKASKGLDLKINPKDLGTDKLNIKPKGPMDDKNPPGPSCGPYIGKDGQLHTPDAKPLRGSDGKPLKAAVGSDGKPVTDKDNNLLGDDGKPLKGPNDEPVKLGSGPYGPAVGPDGTPYDKDGKPLVGPDGKPQKGDIGPNGRPLVDKDGNLLNPAGVPVTDKDGNPFTPGSGPHIGPDGTVYDDNGEPLIGNDGRPYPKAALTPEGNPKFDKDGNVLGPDGKPLKGTDGKPLKVGTGPYAKPDGEVFNSDGSPNKNPNGEPNKAAVGEDGNPVTDAKGNLMGPDGKPLRGPDGKPVRPNPNGPSGPGTTSIAPDGTFNGPNGKPLKGGDGQPLKAALGGDGKPKKNPNGDIVGKDGKPLTGPDGKPIKPGQGAYGPRVGPDGTVYKPNGDPVTGPNNKPVKAGLGPDGKPLLDDNGNIKGPDGSPLVGRDGKPVPASENPFVGPDGTVYKPDGTPIGGGPGGKPLQADLDKNKRPKTDKDGNLLGPDGKPLRGPDEKLLKDGMSPYVNPDGDVMMPNGKPLMGSDKKPQKAGLDSQGEPNTDKDSCVLNPNGQNVKGKDGKPVKVNPNGPKGPGPGNYIGPDGTLYGPDGKPILGPDGKPLKCALGPDGKPLTDKDGNLLGPDGNPLIGPDGKPVKLGKGPYGPSVGPDGTVYGPDGKPILGPDGKPLKAGIGPDGKPLCDENGNLLGADGNPLKDKNGNPIKPGSDGAYVGPDGTVYGPDGKPLLGPDGKPLKAMLGPDGTPITDKDGNLLGPDGKPLKGPDGKPVKHGPGPTVGEDGIVYGPDGKPLLGPDGKPLMAALGPDGKPLKDKNGNLIGPDGKPLLGPDGKPIKATPGGPDGSGPGPYVGPDGTLYGPDGKPVLGPDGKPLKAGRNPDGSLITDDDGNVCEAGPGSYIGPDGTLYGPDGKPLLGPDGKPLKCGLGPDGKPLLDKDGNLLGPDGKPLIGPDGKPIKPGQGPYGPHTGPDGTVYGPDGKPLVGPDGKPLKALFDGPTTDKDGNLLGPDGKPLLDKNGKPVSGDGKPYIGPDGTLFGPDGKPILGPDGKPLKAGLGPDGKPLFDKNGNLLGPDGKPLIGPDGKPFDKGAVGPDGTVFGPDGKPITDKNGNPLKADIGAPRCDENGNLLGPDGKPLTDKNGNPVKPGDGQPFVGPDGTVYGPDGKPILGKDGKPLKAGLDENGLPLTDKDGNILGPDGKPLLGPDGKPLKLGPGPSTGKPLIGPDGKPIKAGSGPYGPAVGPDGTVYGPDGKPMTGPDGKPVKALLGPPKTDKDGNVLGPDGNPVLDKNGKPVPMDGKPYIGPDGTLYGPDGQPILGPDGKPLKCGLDENGNPLFDKNGNLLGPDGKPLIGPDGKPFNKGAIGPDGTLFGPDGKPITDKNGKPLKAGLGEPKKDKDGNLIGEDGNPLLDENGKPIKPGALPYVGPDGTVYGPDGKPLLGPDGKPLKAGLGPDGKPLYDHNGNLLGPDGKPLLGPDGLPIKTGAGPHVGPDGTVYGPDGKPLLGPDGLPLKAMLTPDGKPFTDADGNLLGPDGKPLLGPDGKPIKGPGADDKPKVGPDGTVYGPGNTLGPDGTLLGPDGKPILGPDGKPLQAQMGPAKTDKNGNLLGPDGKPLKDKDGNPVKAAGKPSIGPDGTLYGPDGKPLLGPDGKPLKAGLDENGKPMFDKDGNLLGPDGKPLLGPDGKPLNQGAVGPDGTVFGPDGRPLLDSNGNPLKAALGEPKRDKDGNLLGPDGKPLLGPDGKPVSDGPQALVGPDGKPLKAGLGPNGKPTLGPNGELLGPDGKPLLGPDGKPVTLGNGPAIAPDGTVLGPDGKPLVGPDGRPLRAALGPDGKPVVDKDGNLVGPDGKPLVADDGTNGGPKVDKEGNLVGPDGKPLLGPDGKPLKCGVDKNGNPLVDKDGNILGPDGKPLIGPDGKPLKCALGPDGKPKKDKNGNLLGPDNKPMIPAGSPVSSGLPKSGGPLIGPDGTLLGPDGKPLVGPDGKPLKAGLGPDGKPLTDANGNLLGPDGNPLLGPDGKPIKPGSQVSPDGMLVGPDGKPILGPDGKPLFAALGPDGKPLLDENGNILGPDGQPLLGPDGKPIKGGIPTNGPLVGPDGTLLGPDGKPIIGPDGKPMKAALGPDGLPIVDQDGNLLGPGGRKLLGPDGKPVHAGPSVGPDGVVRGPDGRPIPGKDGKPQIVMLDEFGKPVTLPDGTLMGEDGQPIIGDDGKPINDHAMPPNGPPVGPDGTVYGPDGKPLVGPDGKPLKAGLGPDGVPKTDKDGNLLGPDGKPLKGPNGQPVHAGPLIGPDGTVRNPDGSPVTGLDGQPIKAFVGPDGKLQVAPDGTLLGPDGKPLCGPDGKPLKPGNSIGPDGTLYGPDGQPLLGPDGKPLKAGLGPDGKPLLGPDGALLGPDGKPLIGPDGNLLGADGKPLLGPDGRPVAPGTTVGPDGTVYGPDGKPLVGPDGKPLKAGLGPDGKPLRGPGGELLDEDGNPLVDEFGKPVKPGTSVAPDGTVLGPDGKPLIGPDGKPLKAGLGPDGKPLLGPDGSLLGPDGKPLLGPDGKPVGPGTDRTHATGLGPDGKPLGPLGADGRPLPVEDGGDMTVMCVGPNGDLVPVDVIENPDGTYSIKAAPDMEGDYVADIMGPDGKKIASIPFHVEPQIDGSKVKLSGDSIDGVVKKDKPTSFKVDTSDAGKGPFSASPYEPDTVRNGGIPGVGDKNGPKSPNEEDTDVKIAVIGPNGEPVDCTVVDEGDGIFDVQYKPEKEGPHKVVVLANDELVPGAPVPVNVYPNGDASKCKASGPGIEPRGLVAGKPGTFKVDATRAGDGDVEVIVSSPNPKFDANVKVTKRGKGIFDCEYNPSIKGPYDVTVKFAGEEIPNSTFSVDVAPNPNAEKIKVSGKGLKKGYAKKPNKFTVEPNGAEGALNFDVEGPSKCDIDVEDNGDGTVTVTYTPQEPGEYTINVTLDGAQAPGGPFYPQVEEAQPSEPNKVKLTGDGIGNNVKTGVPATIKIDASDAGPGDIDVNIRGPDGKKVPVKIIDNEDGTYDAVFTPEDVGNHNVDVKFDGKKVPGAPVTVPVKPGIDANKVKCTGDGLKNPKAKHDNQFTIDTSSAGPGDDVEVEVIPLDKNGNPVPDKKVPVTIKDLGNGVKSAVFNPDNEGPYMVDVKFCGKNPKDFPCAIDVKGPGAKGCRLPNINGLEIEPDQEITIPVDISAAGPGDFKVTCINEVTGEEDTVRVIDGPNNTKNVTLKPDGSGPHTITMTFDDEDLPGGPFTISVKKPVGADACSMKPGKDNKLYTLDGDDIKFLIDLSNAGPGNLTGVAKTPSGKTIPITVEVDKETGLADIKFTPSEKGVHLINLLFNGHAIPGCPFEMDIKGPADVSMNGGKPKDDSKSVCLDLDATSLVVVPNMVNTKVVKGQDMKIPIDLTFSGDGEIEVTCIHDSTLEHVPAKLVDTPDGKEVQLSPTKPGWYTVHLKFNGQNLPGSPYKFEVKEPTGADAVKIKRGPKSPLKDGEPITLIVDVSKAGEGQLLGTCKAPDSSNIPVKTKELDNGDIEVSFMPKGDGDHTLNLQFNNKSIPGCPATINIKHVTPESLGVELDLAPWEVDASAKGAKGVRHPNFDDVKVQLNQIMKIPLDLSAAGPGNVEVSCMHEKSKQPCPVNVIPTKQGAVEISVKPIETGPHLLHVTFNGVDLPKSPFRFMVEPPSGANAVTLKQNNNAVKVVKDGLQFAIDCSRAGVGVLTASCTGPDGQLVPCECKKSGSDQLITIKPNKPGLHSLEVMWDGQPIPGSPIEVMIDMVDGRIVYELCDILLLLLGAFTVRTPDLSNIQLEINQFIRIPIDCRLAGPGKLQVTCKNEDTGTSIDVEQKKTGDMYEITIKPTDPGKHCLNIMWDGKHIPGSPAYFNVKGPAPARLCYILSGADHIKCKKGSISFRCTTKEAGKGELTAIGVDPFGKQFECEITEEPDLTYAIAFKPEVPGVHNVDVKYNGLSINGSPALIDIKSLPQGDEGGISLELISCRDTTAGSGGTETQVQQKATITLPIPKKDHQGLSVTCQGPDGSDIKCQLGASTDSGINILFEPKSGGKHRLTVMLNGNNYPGTPVDVEVQGL